MSLREKPLTYPYKGGGERKYGNQQGQDGRGGDG